MSDSLSAATKIFSKKLKWTNIFPINGIVKLKTYQPTLCEQINATLFLFTINLAFVN